MQKLHNLILFCGRLPFMIVVCIKCYSDLIIGRVRVSQDVYERLNRESVEKVCPPLVLSDIYTKRQLHHPLKVLDFH